MQRTSDLLQRANAFYAECMNCENTSAQCPGVWKDHALGVPPRGFRFGTVPIKLLVVAKNPGHPLKGERERYAGQSGANLFELYRHFQEAYYADPQSIPERSNLFHRRLFAYLRYFLDLPDDAPPERIYEHAAHTNLVKCSTTGEQDRLDPDTMEECFNKYFLAEVEILQPRVLLALGREVERFLVAKQHQHGRAVVYIKHPSYPYRRDRLGEALRDIRARIRIHF